LASISDHQSAPFKVLFRDFHLNIISDFYFIRVKFILEPPKNEVEPLAIRRIINLDDDLDWAPLSPSFTTSDLFKKKNKIEISSIEFRPSTCSYEDATFIEHLKPIDDVLFETAFASNRISHLSWAPLPETHFDILSHQSLIDFAVDSVARCVSLTKATVNRDPLWGRLKQLHTVTSKRQQNDNISS
jgi:hypothetical protein